MSDNIEQTASEKMDSSDLKQEPDSSETKAESKQSIEPPFKLTRNKFLLSYKFHYAMKSVFIHPFEAESFGLPEFVHWVTKAKEFTIKKTWNGNSVGMLTFATYSDADSAICDLRLVLGEKIEVRHTKCNQQNPEVEVDSLLDYVIRDSLATRIIVLEGLPPGMTQEQISEFFPDARTVILVNYDSDIEGIALVEYGTTDKARVVLEEHKFPEDDRSYIVVEGQRVVLSKYKNRLNQAERAMRKHPSAPDPRQHFEKEPLDDTQRLYKCTKLKELTDMRDACLDDMSQEPLDRVHTYVDLTQNMGMLAAYLNWDASRREKENLSLPEPDDMKTWKQFYKETLESGGYGDRSTAIGGEVRSLLDLNPFDVPGSKRKTEIADDAAGPAKRVTEPISFPVELAQQPGGYSMIQGLRNISQALSAQLNRIDETLKTSWTSDSVNYGSGYNRQLPLRRYDGSSSRRSHSK